MFRWFVMVLLFNYSVSMYVTLMLLVVSILSEPFLLAVLRATLPRYMSPSIAMAVSGRPHTQLNISQQRTLQHTPDYDWLTLPSARYSIRRGAQAQKKQIILRRRERAPMLWIKYAIGKYTNLKNEWFHTR